MIVARAFMRDEVNDSSRYQYSCPLGAARKFTVPIGDCGRRCITPAQRDALPGAQVLYEYWVVATRPVEQNGLGMTVAEAAADLVAVLQRFHLYRDERAIFDGWQKLVLQYQVFGKNAHDARLVVAMERHDISHILTFNTSDFSRYPQIQILDPREVATSVP